IGAVQLAQVTLDVARRHASRVESDDFLVEALEPPLSLGQEPRLERALAVPGNAHFDRASLGLDGTRRIAVAYVATAPLGLLLVTEVLGHFRFEEALHQRAFQLREQALWAEEVLLRREALHELVEQGRLGRLPIAVAHLGFGMCFHERLPSCRPPRSHHTTFSPAPPRLAPAPFFPSPVRLEATPRDHQVAPACPSSCACLRHPSP